jgi:hypothetical protein
MSNEIIGRCWHCGTGLTKADYGRETACLACGKATRVCLNCQHFARGRPNDCVEPLAERVLDKTRANFCEHFDPTAQPAAPGEATTAADAARQAAADLFR